MANVLINSTDQATSSVALGQNIGKALSASSLIGAPDYKFDEPKTGLFADLFPSESTWHPLYDHDYREIANHLFSIDTLNVPKEQKDYYIRRVREVTIESYERGAYGSLYKFLVFATIVLIIMLYFKSEYTMYAVFITGVISLGLYLYASVWARGAGETYWTTFSADLSSKINTGMMPNAILTAYGADFNREKDRLALSRVSSPSYSGPSMAGALVGGLLGSFFNK